MLVTTSWQEALPPWSRWLARRGAYGSIFHTEPKANHSGLLFEDKSVFVKHEEDGSHPLLFEKHAECLGAIRY